MRDLRDKYRNDVSFRQLVDLMVGQISEAHFTPSEMREAAMVASILYEEINYRRVVYVDRDIECALRDVHDKIAKKKEGV